MSESKPHIKWLCERTARQIERCDILRKRTNWAKKVAEDLEKMTECERAVLHHLRRVRDLAIKEEGE